MEIGAQKRKRIEWQVFMRFSSESESKMFLRNENYSISSSDYSSKGKRTRYHCSKHENCKANLVELIESETEITLYYNGEVHSVKEKLGKGVKIENVVDKYICDISSLTPDDIQKILPKKYVFTSKQLSQLKQRKKRRINKDPLITYLDINNYLETVLSFPEDEDEAFCINTIISETEFYAAFSSKRLIRLIKNCTCLQTEATYKISRLNFPILIAGISDNRRRFHPLIIAITQSEKKEDYVRLFDSLKMCIDKLNLGQINIESGMGDAAESITAAFECSFPGIKRTYCWYHVSKRFKIMIKKYCEKQYRKQLLHDLSIIQLSNSDIEFLYHCHLFILKWSSFSNKCELFCQKFKLKWVEKKPYWYEGSNPMHPSTNNGLESFNKYYKRYVTQHTKKSIKEVITNTMRYINTLSIKRQDGGVYQYSNNIPKDLSLFTKAYQFASKINLLNIEKSKFSIDIINNAIITNFIEPKCFDELKIRKIHYITIRKNGNVILCDCKVFQKQYICCHSLAIQLLEKTEICPLSAQIFPLEGKRKRGRPV